MNLSIITTCGNGGIEQVKFLLIAAEKSKAILNQVDKSGMPYVFHPFHLAEQMDCRLWRWRHTDPCNGCCAYVIKYNNSCNQCDQIKNVKNGSLIFY